MAFLFNGLEEILMGVIKATAHSDSRMEDAERLENALKAIYGDHYDSAYKKPCTGLTHDDFLEIVKRKKNGEAVEAVTEQPSPIRRGVS
ncbi:MAG: hypothetical protein R3E13_06840 [Alphaproteobacteria bacterium]